MVQLALVVAKKAITGLLGLLLTEKIVMEVVLMLLERLAERSDATWDDEIIDKLQREYDKKYS